MICFSHLCCLFSCLFSPDAGAVRASGRRASPVGRFAPRHARAHFPLILFSPAAHSPSRSSSLSPPPLHSPSYCFHSHAVSVSFPFFVPLVLHDLLPPRLVLPAVPSLSQFCFTDRIAPCNVLFSVSSIFLICLLISVAYLLACTFHSI